MKKEKLKKRILEELKEEIRKGYEYMNRGEFLGKINVTNGDLSVALIELEKENKIRKESSGCGGIQYYLK